VGGSWRTGVEGDVLVAGAFVDGEWDEGGGHLVCVNKAVGDGEIDGRSKEIPYGSSL
jgi:hypothetical protein